MNEEAKATGLIPMPGKLLSRLHAIELENIAYQTKFAANNATAKAIVESYLEDTCGIDLDAEKWDLDLPQRRFRRIDVRPPELRPEMEVKPTNGKVPVEA